MSEKKVIISFDEHERLIALEEQFDEKVNDVVNRYDEKVKSLNNLFESKICIKEGKRYFGNNYYFDLECLDKLSWPKRIVAKWLLKI